MTTINSWREIERHVNGVTPLPFLNQDEKKLRFGALTAVVDGCWAGYAKPVGWERPRMDLQLLTYSTYWGLHSC